MKTSKNIHKLCLVSLLLLQLPLTIANAESSNVDGQITQLQSEIKKKQNEIIELRLSQNDADVVEFEHDGLKFTVQVEVKDNKYHESKPHIFDDTDVFLHLTIENMTDEAKSFLGTRNFKVSLAKITQPGVTSLDGLDIEAIPEHSFIEGKLQYNMTSGIANSKDLIFRYDSNSGETVFEQKINDLKHISSTD